jgi:hypothetical protein
MMNSNFAVVLVMVYTYLPFMILPLYANLEKLDPTLERSRDGSRLTPWQVFRDVTLPLSIPGIIAGGLLVFIPAAANSSSRASSACLRPDDRPRHLGRVSSAATGRWPPPLPWPSCWLWSCPTHALQPISRVKARRGGHK